MDVRYGTGETEFGPGVSVTITAAEVANAIEAYLVAHGIHVRGARTITVNGELCEIGHVYVDPAGFVVANGERLSGRGLYQSGRGSAE